MIIPTHIVISNILNRNIVSLTRVQLPASALSYGSCAPDIIVKYRKIKHYKSISFDIVMDLTNKLYEDILAGNISENAAAFRLGIITHYLCDFFCLPHNDSYFRSHFNAHMLYEAKLHYYFKNYAAHQSISPDDIVISQPDQIKNFINETHRKYMEEKDGFMKDVTYSICVISSVCTVIINSALEKSRVPWLFGASLNV